MNLNVGEVQIHPADLAYQISKAEELLRDNYKGVIDLVVELDDYIDDLQFTKALHSRLSGIIAGCNAQE